MSRKNGRTFRFILEALRVASEGKKVFYLTHKLELKAWYFDKICKVLTSYVDPEYVRIDSKRFRISFPNGGSVHVKGYGQAMCGEDAGHEPPHIIEDY